MSIFFADVEPHILCVVGVIVIRWEKRILLLVYANAAHKDGGTFNLFLLSDTIHLHYNKHISINSKILIVECTFGLPIKHI